METGNWEHSFLLLNSERLALIYVQTHTHSLCRTAVDINSYMSSVFMIISIYVPCVLSAPPRAATPKPAEGVRGGGVLALHPDLQPSLQRRPSFSALTPGLTYTGRPCSPSNRTASPHRPTPPILHKSDLIRQLVQCGWE